LWWAPFLAAAALLLAAPAAADIFRYVDDTGVIHYTDDMEKVPAEYKDSVQQQKSVRREAAAGPDTRRQQPMVVGAEGEPAGAVPPEESSESESAEPEAEEAEASEGAGEDAAESAAETGEGQEMQAPGSAPEVEEAAGDAAETRGRLEQERQALLERKEALANDATYQKRKIKRKYINRPHIQELLEEEARIDLRLAEIEKQLQQ
jgi:hypothetical protein